MRKLIFIASFLTFLHYLAAQPRQNLKSTLKKLMQNKKPNTLQ